jgi:regulator of replication initiation timing
MSGKDYADILAGVERSCELVQPLFDLRGMLEQAVGLDEDIAGLKAEKDRMVDENNNFEAECKLKQEALDREVSGKEAWAERTKGQLKSQVDAVQSETEKQIDIYRQEEAMWKQKRDDADLAHSKRIKEIREEIGTAEGRLREINNKLEEARRLVAPGG